MKQPVYSFLTIGLLLLIPYLSLAVDYYWVGGSGNWSDITHWATTSGGNNFHNIVPTANDNVIFDANSFDGPDQVVTVNNENIFCRDMIWRTVTNRPTLRAEANRILNVFGSVQLSPDMTFDFRGDVILSGTDAGHTIDMAGHPFLSSLFVEGSGGEWTLNSALTVNNEFEFRTGTLITNDQPLTCAYFYVNSPGGDHLLDLTASEVLITGNDYVMNFQDFYAADLRMSPDNGQFADATLRFTSPVTTLWLSLGSIGLEFGEVIFESTVGLARIEEENGLSTSFRRLTLAKNGRFVSNFSADTLQFAPGKTYIFQPATTYRFSVLTATGSCENPINLFTAQAGAATNFQYAGDGAADIQLQYVSLKDIHADDNGTGISLEVVEGVDLGNNNGWTIVPKTTDRLYWVGGTGMWDDPANWSFTSGGVGGACIPTAGDDVVFDANSFTAAGQSVMINVENAYCRSMIWEDPTGTPQLIGALDQELHIYGDLLLSPDMNWNVQGHVYFESLTPDRRIRSAGQVFLRNIYFRSQSGGWIQDDVLRVVEDIHIVAGSWTTNDQGVFCFRLRSDYTQPRTINLGSSVITSDGPFSIDHLFNATNLTLNAGTSELITMRTGNIYVVGSGTLQFHWINLVSGGLVQRQPDQNGQQFDLRIDSLASGFRTFFRGPLHMDYARLEPAVVHRIAQGDTLTVRTLEIPTRCDLSPAELSCDINNETAYIVGLQGNTLERLVIKDVHSVGTGIMNAQNSVDLGNTDGWLFSNSEPRTLYWVGGTGDWNDPSHWSDNSGGPGGECIPTANDDVVFDANSFTAPGQIVSADLNGTVSYCRNMTWTDAVNQPIFRIWDLQNFGSIQLAENMTLIATDMTLRSPEPGQSVHLRDHEFFNITLRGSGEWTLTSPMRTNYLGMQEGTFRSAGFPVILNIFSALHMRPKTLDFGGSHWLYNGSRDRGESFRVNDRTQLTITGEPGLVEATSSAPWFQWFDPLTNQIDFLCSNVEGTSTFEIIDQVPSFLGRLEFRNDGYIQARELFMDTLIFSAGKSYQLEANGIFYVEDYLQMIGNNCTPIQLSSTAQGTRSEIRMDDGFVKADFVQMRDQLASGANTEFLAGRHSTDIGGSNFGWVFASRREFQNEGFLGSDIVLCENEAITLNANNFSPGERYRWQDSSTDSTFVTDQPGTYWAEVTFTNNCIIRDSVLVLAPEQFAPDLPEDTLLCEGDSLLLTPSPEYAGLTFEWQDGSTNPTYLADREGQFTVTLTLNNCAQSDSVLIEYQSPPQVDLGGDRTLCAGEVLVLDAGPEGDIYEWQDGTTDATFTVTEAGTYSVTVVRQVCTVDESVTIDYFPPILLDLGPDTTVCADEVVLLDASVPGTADYLWQDGTRNAALGALEAGTYTVTVTQNDCPAFDTITINHLDLPIFELGADTTICEGESIRFDGRVDMNTSYSWSTGETNAVIVANEAGNYTLTANRNGCEFTDAINLGIRPLPEIELGPNQTTCAGETIVLDASFPNATYTWQDGTTNPTYSATQDGTYEVTLTLDGCTNSDAVDLTFTPLPQFDLGNDTLLCDGESLTLDAAVPGGTYTWQDGSFDNTLLVAEAGLYTVDVLADGCVASDSIRVTYPQFPENLLAEDQILCAGEVYEINLSIPQATYLWQDGSNSAYYPIVEDGTYSLTASVGRCTRSDDITVVFNPVPVFELGPDTIICEDQSVDLSIDVIADSYQWQTGASTPQISVNTPGEVVATAQLDNCAFTDRLFVDVQQKSNLDLGLDTTFCEDQGYRLQVNVGGDQIRWQDGTTGPTYSVTQSGMYSVQVFDRQCIMEDTIRLQSRECWRFQTYIPTAFSPDGQEPNNTFRAFFPPTLQIESFDMEIMDRWGNIVFRTDNPEAEWDGTRNGEPLPIAVYAYVIRISYIDDYRADEEVIVGDVTLIR